MYTYNWAKLANGLYCPLRTLDLTNVMSTLGVYVIWHSGLKPHAVRVGQGIIGTRLGEHRADPEILACEVLGQLVASWINPPAAHLDGLENYLGNLLQPIVGSRFPIAEPIAVNLPL